MLTGNQLDNLDKQILTILIQDARTPYLEIARSCKVSGATVHLRVQKMERLGVITGSHIKVNPEKLGVGICAYIGIFLRTGRNYKEIIAELKAIPEIVECHYTTGNYSVFVKVYCETTADLRQVLNEKIQEIDAIQRTETLISLEQTFERQIQIKNLPKKIS